MKGEFSCGSSVSENFLRSICNELAVSLTVRESKQTREGLECYSCSRERRKLIFDAAKNEGVTTIAFGHHRDDSIRTLLMNLFHKAEFAANLPKVPMYDYGVTIIRPLIYVAEEQIREFAKLYGFNRVTCMCPVGQNSLRKETERLLSDPEETFPNNCFFRASLRNHQQRLSVLRRITFSHQIKPVGFSPAFLPSRGSLNRDN